MDLSNGVATSKGENTSIETIGKRTGHTVLDYSSEELTLLDSSLWWSVYPEDIPNWQAHYLERVDQIY